MTLAGMIIEMLTEKIRQNINALEKKCEVES